MDIAVVKLKGIFAYSFICCTVVFSVQSVYGQYTKGSTLVGVGGWFSSNNSTSYDYVINRTTQQTSLITKKSSDWNLYTTLYGGYFITNRLMAGLTTQINSLNEVYFYIDANNKQLPTLINKRYTAQVGPKVRYYILNKLSGIFLEGQYTIGLQTDIDRYGSSRVKNGRIQSTSLGGGMNYFFNERWALEGMISTVFERRQADIELLPDVFSTYKAIENSNQLNFRFGITYTFKQKHYEN